MDIKRERMKERGGEGLMNVTYVIPFLELQNKPLTYEDTHICEVHVYIQEA